MDGTSDTKQKDSFAPAMNDAGEKMEQQKSIMQRMTDSLARTRRELHDPVYKRKYIHSALLWWSYICLGVRTVIHGPALLDIAELTGVTLTQASVYFTVGSVGSIIGTALMGILFDKLRTWRHFYIPGTIILAAITITAIPQSKIYGLTLFLFFANALVNAAFDAGVVPDMMGTWGMEGKMVVVFLHFCYAFGTIFSPMIVRPFVSRRSTDASVCAYLNLTQTTTTLSTPAFTSTVASSVPSTTESISCITRETQIQYPYMIAGALALFSGILIAFEACYRGRQVPPSGPDKDVADVIMIEDHRNPRVLPIKLHILVLFLIGGIYFFYVASVATIANFFVPFTVSAFNWEKERAIDLITGFNTAFAAFRLGATLLIKFSRPVYFLLGSSVIILGSLVGMWVSTAAGNGAGMGACFILYGLGISVVYPTGIVMMEHDYIKITGIVTAVIQLSANVPGIVDPPLSGHLIENVSPMWYIYLSGIEACIGFLFFIGIVVVKRTLIKQHDEMVAKTVDMEMNGKDNKGFDTKDDWLSSNSKDVRL